MNEQWTPAAQRAIDAARQLAHHQQAGKTVPIHLLQALLQEPQGRAYLLTMRAGTNEEELNKWVETIQADTIIADQHPALSAKLDSILVAATALRRELLLSDPVSGDLLLYVLLRDDDEAKEILEGMGLDFAQLEESIMSEMAGPPLEMDESLELNDVCVPMDTARIIDANANRAREALRVIEEYCRFVLEDGILTGELKTLRHELTSALAQFPVARLLAARETQSDVGTALSTSQERSRSSMRSVVAANVKRLQESLRSLEEYGKLHNTTLSARIKQMRYRAYTLERMLLLGQSAREKLADIRLYVLLTGSSCWGSLEWTLRESAEGGVQMFQLREKTSNDRDLLSRARQVRHWTRETETLFIMNDRCDIARLVEADGVHLGQEELPVSAARRLLGQEAIIGVSTHDPDQVRQAHRNSADYIGVGPTFPSKTKEFGEFPGLEFVSKVVSETSLPAFAIGGINVGNLPQLLDAGCRRVAVGHAICASETPQATARAMRQLLD